MPSAPLPILLQKDNAVSLSVYDESANRLTEQVPLPGESPYSGDYTECTIATNPKDTASFAHVTTNKLIYSKVERRPPGADADASTQFGMKTLFSVDMPHVVLKTLFSPKGNYLVTYAMMDPKRTPDGNLSIFETTTGKLLRRAMQGAWPAVAWTAEEDYLVRWTQGSLQVLQGHLTETEEPMLNRMDLMLAKDKEIDYSCSPTEGVPLLSLFKPIEKNRPASFSIFRLPKVEESEALLNLGFGRAEAGTSTWSPSGKHVALLVKQGSGGNNPQRNSGPASYYGNLTLHMVDVFNRNMRDVKLKGPNGIPEVVHDCRWAPRTDELLVIHGNMPRNKATIVSPRGVALMTFGEGPRNMASWSPDGSTFLVGGSGNLAGDYQFYSYHPGSASSPTGSPNSAGGAGHRKLSSGDAEESGAAPPAANVTQCVGTFSEKCSVEKWAPDSHHIFFSTIFTRLRVDNKLVIAKKNGARMLTEKFPALYGAYWVQMEETYPPRPASPRPSHEESPKPQAYRPPGGHSERAAALLRGPDPTAATAVKPAGPMGAKLVANKKKGGKRR